MVSDATLLSSPCFGSRADQQNLLRENSGSKVTALGSRLSQRDRSYRAGLGSNGASGRVETDAHWLFLHASL
jgi:hypothetical protein